MKRVGGLFERIVDRANLGLALYRAAQGKGDRREVRDLLENREAFFQDVRARWLEGRFTFGSYRSFAVRDTKTREIHAPVFADRVIHHAMVAVTGPVLERGAVDHSYACRTGKGHHAALLQARKWVFRGGWYGKMDVERFYDSVCHARLICRLERRFREKRLLAAWENLLASYETAPGRGLPIGALTSQYLGNFVLDEVDARIKAEGGVKRYLRYMDDSLCVTASREAVLRVRDVASAALGDLGLKLKHGGEWNRCERGIPWLGFVVYPDRVRLNAVGKQRLRRKVKAAETAWGRGILSDEALSHRVTSLWAHAEWADDRAWRRMVCEVGMNPGETTPATRDARRFLEQPGGQVPLGLSEQEPSGEREQEPGVSSCVGVWNGGE